MTLRFLPGLAAFLVALSSVQAEPLVVGFSRFHSEKASAAGGRLLYNELGCANCHEPTTGLPARRGPLIQGVTERLYVDWLRQFLAAPDTAHAGSTMPALLFNAEPGDPEAILHYLASLKTKPSAKTKPPTHVNTQRGEILFHTVGCVACHAPGAQFQPETGSPKESEFTHPSIAFPDLNGKFTLAGLSAFLLNPLATRPDGRMPRLAMDESDAVDIAGYLLNFEGSDGKSAPHLKPFVFDKALAVRGQEIVAAARCAACHDLPKEVAAKHVALKQLNVGCLSPAPPPGTPHYKLTPIQREALEMFLQSAPHESPAAETAALTLQALNCSACHERDGLGGPDAARKVYFTGDHNLGDTGVIHPRLRA